MAALTKDAILGADDLKVEVVAVPEWGGDVKVRALRGSERDFYEQSLFTGEGENRKFTLANARAKLMVLCIVDDEGKRMFQDGEADLLGQRNAAVLDRLYDVAQRLSGIGGKALEDAVKN